MSRFQNIKNASVRIIFPSEVVTFLRLWSHEGKESKRNCEINPGLSLSRLPCKIFSRTCVCVCVCVCVCECFHYAMVTKYFTIV